METCSLERLTQHSDEVYVLGLGLVLLKSKEPCVRAQYYVVHMSIYRKSLNKSSVKVYMHVVTDKAGNYCSMSITDSLPIDLVNFTLGKIKDLEEV